MKRKLWNLISLFTVAVFVLAACGPAATQTEEPTDIVVEEAPGAEEEPTEVVEEPTEVVEEPTEVPTPTEEVVAEPVATLKIWADDTRTPVLLELADDFLAEYNVELVVEDLGRVQDIRAPIITAAPAGEGPDIFIGVHDWLGGLVDSGLVTPIDLGDKRDEFVELALDAFTYTDGNLYGVPYATENLGLFYNTELVPEPPTTWAELLEIGRELKAEGTVDYAIAIAGGAGYNSLPIQTSFGGYVFGVDENGAWNPDDVGLDSEGMIEAVTWMTEAAEEGLMSTSFDIENARQLFETGKIPFIMDGPWDLERFRTAGVPFALAPFPEDGAAFLGVQGFMVNAFSENILLAQAFLTEYVATEEFMQQMLDLELRPSAFKSVLATMDDPDLVAMGEAGTNAIPMPNIPEMGSVWSAWDNGILLAVTGEQTPEEAMTDAAGQVRALITGALAGMVNLPGSYQMESGCGADWDPACEATAMEQGDDGLYRLTVPIPTGEYEFKVALDGAWTVNYGSDGAQDGPNYPLSLAADSTVTFTYDPDTHLVEVTTE
jgi:arabinogalactan oligomer / maltooligosaccharide transport system substrate-binding protein